MYSQKLFFVFLVVLLVGCNATVETEVNLSDLLTGENKIVSGRLYVEVSSCNSYEDSRLDSSAVKETKRKVPDIFSGAKYVECFSKQFESYAHFSLPIVIDIDGDDTFASDSALNLISSPQTSLLSVGIPPQVTRKLDRYENDSFFSQPLDLSVNIKMVNDLGKSHPFKVVSAYVDEIPYVFGRLTAEANGSFDVTLSDVSVGQARFTGKSMVLLH